MRSIFFTIGGLAVALAFAVGACKNRDFNGTILSSSDESITTTLGTGCAALRDATIKGDGGVFLGVISNKYSSDSIFNEHGTYGSEFSSTSIFNKYGSWGGEVSSNSPFNTYTSTPPKVFSSSGSFLCDLTRNKSLSSTICSPDALIQCKGDY